MCTCFIRLDNGDIIRYLLKVCGAFTLYKLFYRSLIQLKIVANNVSDVQPLLKQMAAKPCKYRSWWISCSVPGSLNFSLVYKISHFPFPKRLAPSPIFSRFCFYRFCFGCCNSHCWLLSKIGSNCWNLFWLSVFNYSTNWQWPGLCEGNWWAVPGECCFCWFMCIWWDIPAKIEAI